MEHDTSAAKDEFHTIQMEKFEIQAQDTIEALKEISKFKRQKTTLYIHMAADVVSATRSKSKGATLENCGTKQPFLQ